MKKKAIFLLVIILLNLLLPINITENSAVNIGDTYTYEISKARIYAIVGENSYSSDGFEFSAKNYPPGTLVSCEITDYIDGDIELVCSIDNRTQISYSVSNWVHIILDYYMIYTTTKAYELAQSWLDILLLELFFFGIRPYIHPTTYSYEFFNTLAEVFNSTYKSYSTIYPNFECDFNIQSSNNLVYIESWLGGKIKGSCGEIFGFNDDVPTNINFGNNFHIAFMNETGLVQGMGYRGWVKGKINETSVKVSIEYQYELHNYNLPDFIFGIYYYDFNSNYYYLFLLPVIIIGGAIGFIVYRRKKKKVGNELL